MLAIATNVNEAASSAFVLVEIRRPQGPGDTSPPVVSNLRFAGQLLLNGHTYNNPGVLTATIVDDTVVSSAWIGPSQLSAAPLTVSLASCLAGASTH